VYYGSLKGNILLKHEISTGRERKTFKKGNNGKNLNKTEQKILNKKKKIGLERYTKGTSLVHKIKIFGEFLFKVA